MFIGEFPRGLTRDATGNLFGITAYGGDFTLPGAGATGYGVIYKISPSGAFSRLFSFSGSNGAGSNSPLLRKGNVLYGTTLTSGPVSGNIFKINDTGFGSGFTVLHSGGAGGYGYSGGLTKNPLGTDFYGTAHYASPSGPGGIYKITSTGVYTFLKAFSGPDGAYPNSTLIADAQGKFYGMTQGYYAGCSNGSGEGGYGNVFKYDPVTNAFETLHQFTGGPADGANPCNGELLRDAAGNMYGLTQFGGANNGGVLFRITP